MIIPNEIFMNLAYTISYWEKNYQFNIEDNVLYLQYIEAGDHNASLDIPSQPCKEDFEDEDEFLAEMEDWEEEVEVTLNDYLNDLKGKGYEVALLGNYTNSKGFVFTIDC